MANAEDIARDEAIAWRNRLGSADENEWTAFLDWLARDPANRSAYDKVALTDTQLSEALAESPINEPRRAVSDAIGPPSRPRHYAAWLSAVAASVALIVFGYSHFHLPRSFDAIETAAGVQRTVSLPEGTRVHLNGASRILIDRHDPRFVQLERGEATFEVVHHAKSPFTVEVNGATIRDVGTVFNISTSSKGFELAVAQGAVILNPGAEDVRLSQGGMLFVPRKDGPIRVGSRDVATIASWRQHHLIYNEEPIETVALDLTRMLGTPVTVAPELSGILFTGVIIPTADEDLFFRRLEHLLGVKATRSAAGWRLDAADDAARRSVARRHRG